MEEAEALPLLKAAFDLGINTWDTANLYSNGRSEEIIGKAIKTYNIPREKVVLMTKCYYHVGGECYVCSRRGDLANDAIEEGAPFATNAEYHKDNVNRQGEYPISTKCVRICG